MNSMPALLFAAASTVVALATERPADAFAMPSWSSVALMDCPDRIVYGDPALPNRIAFLTGDKERVLHFERVAVRIDSAGRHTFYFPSFVRPDNIPVNLHFVAIPDGREEGYSVRFQFMGGVNSDCMRIMPQLRWGDLRSSMKVLAFQAPGQNPGRLSAEIRILSDDDAPSGLIATIETEDVHTLSASSSDARGTYLQNKGDGSVDSVAIVGGSAIFNEGLQTLEVHTLTEAGSHRGTSIHRVTGAPGMIAHSAGEFVTLWNIHELSSDALIYDEYRGERPREDGIEPIFERPVTAAAHDLDAAQLVARVEIRAVTVVPPLPLLVLGSDAELHRVAVTAPLMLADVPAGSVNDLSAPTPGRSYFAYYPQHDLGRPHYTETIARGAEKGYVFTMKDGIRRPEGEESPAEPEPDPAVAEAVGILMAVLSAVMAIEPEEEHRVPEVVAEVLSAHGIAAQQAVTAEDLGRWFDEGQTPFFLASYDADVVAEALRQVMRILDGTDAMLESMMSDLMKYEVVLSLDESGAPIRRNFSESGTDFTIEYHGDRVVLRAENERQGFDSLTASIAPGTLDLLQWNEALTRLPLAPGFERTIPLFDLAVSSGTSMGLDADGQGYYRNYVSGSPTYLTATVRVSGRERIEVHGELIPAYRVEVFFRGDAPRHPVMSIVGPEPNTRGREGDPLIYHVRAAAPHVVLAVDWGETVVQRLLR